MRLSKEELVLLERLAARQVPLSGNHVRQSEQVTMGGLHQRGMVRYCYGGDGEPGGWEITEDGRRALEGKH